MVLKSYRELIVWQKAMDLVVESYKIAGLLPKTELYGLKSQIERAAVSVPANVAEGHGREHLGDYLRHLSIATGSLMELETHLLIAERLAFLAGAHIARALQMSAEVGRMLAGLSRSLRKHLAPETRHPAPDT
jgi:four helix bundle protein